MDNQRQLMMLLEAIAACEPCDQVPEVGGIDSSQLPDLLVRAARSDWINVRTFMHDGSLPTGTILRLTKQGHDALRTAILRQDGDVSEAPQTSLEEKRAKRALVMAHLYELTEANTQRVVDTSFVSGSLGWDGSTIQPVVRYLADRGLLRYVTLSGGISITAKGVDEVEEAKSDTGDGTDSLAGIRVTTGETSGNVTVQIVQGDSGRAAIGSGPHGRRLLPGLARSSWKIIASALAILLAGGLAALFANGGKSQRHAAHNPATTTTVRVTSIPSGRRTLEYADNTTGSPVFASPQGASVAGNLPGRIPYGTKVYVVCWAPNKVVVMSSVTALYLIASGRWAHNYVVSDTMSNGGPLGNTDTPNVDPRVHPCSAS
ncbi:MAG: hypothetical protein ACHQCH_07415 [Solirubrobacterales bacterium]